MSRWTRAPYLLLGLIAAAALGLACTQSEFVPAESRDQIAVSGRGEVSADPDTVILSLGVSVLRDSVRSAIAEAAESMNEVLEVLDGLGVEAEDIQTSNFAVFPEFNFGRDGDRELIGFRVSNQVSVKLREIDAAGELIDAAAEAAGDDVVINGVSFTIDDPSELLDEARALAVADARAKAEQLAELADVELGGVIAINESGGFIPGPQPFFSREAAADGAEFAPTPVAPGQTTISLSVSIVYELQ